jgi:hypothetical protein
LFLALAVDFPGILWKRGGFEVSSLLGGLLVVISPEDWAERDLNWLDIFNCRNLKGFFRQLHKDIGFTSVVKPSTG